MSVADNPSDLVIERAAATVRRYLADPGGCEAAIQKLLAQLRSDAKKGEGDRDNVARKKRR